MSHIKYHSIEHVESENYSSTTSVSLVVQELTESEVSSLSPSVIQASLEEKYEIRDDDTLTEHDFFSLMNSEDESESESESDVEYHWFPSLLKNSSIQFLEDDHNDDTLMDVSSTEVTAEIEEQDSDTQAEEEEEEEEGDKNRHTESLKRKRHSRNQRHSKRYRKARKIENVPIEVVYIKL